jgi:adenylate cyclase
MSRVEQAFERLKQQRLEGRYEQERLDGTRLYLKAKTVALVGVGVWLGFALPTWPLALYYQGVILILLVLKGYQFYLLRKEKFGLWVPYAVILAEAMILGAAFLFRNPFAPDEVSAQMMLRFGNFVYFFIIIGGAALSLSPGLVVWAGVCVSMVWGLGAVWIMSLPDTITLMGAQRMAVAGISGFISLFMHPNSVHVESVARDILVALMVSVLLVVVVWRSRRLVRSHADSERRRANLARYFSPNILDELAGSDSPLQEVRQHEVAILFADIVGFTGMSESMPAEKFMVFLREYHRRMEEEVFRHGGTLDKFIGDAVMASFGSPQQTPQDATNALRCARSMVDSIEAWNRERKGAGEPPIHIGVGVHFGPVVMGDIGSERTAAFAVVGDTTNTASRLESLSRNLDADVVVSQDLIEAVRTENPEGASELEGYVEVGPQEIRGREQPIRVWTLKVASKAEVG